MAIPWDTTGISDEDFPTAPDGVYEFKITSAEETKTKTKGYPAVVVRAQIIEALEHNGVGIMHQVTIMPGNMPGAGIAKKFLKSIGEPYEGKIDIVAMNWIGKKFTGYIIRDKYEGKTRNKIKWTQSYRPDENVSQKGKASDETIPF